MDSRFCSLRAAESPTSNLTLAPGCELKVIVTVANLTGLPMSIAYLAYWLFSLPGSAEALVRGSKPVAPTGCSTLADASGPGLERGWLTAGPPLGHSANAAMAARTSTLTPMARALGNLPGTGRKG